MNWKRIRRAAAYIALILLAIAFFWWVLSMAPMHAGS